MKKVSVYQLRDKLAYYLDLVTKNETAIVVQRYNLPTAVIVPFKKSFLQSDFDSYFGFLTKGETGKEFLKRIRRSKKEKELVSSLRKRYG